MIEPEPACAGVHAALFLPITAYERLVSSSFALEGFRIALIFVAQA
ncbi:MAG TPA: hypothetical protein VMD25_10530 [Acidobacteriaceae bacterium]|nr:hypothetical protein [Acidobacteriaceae bacterium]